MYFAPIVLTGFDGREEELTKIKRYIHEITPIMFYRTDDLIHSRRTLWHLEEAIPKIVSIYGNSFNVEFARTEAFVHDDVEILSGDVQLYDKERMSREELEALAEEEKLAIPRLVARYNKIANGFDYARLLMAAKEKNCLEAQFVSFFDKFDGAGEAWHEVWAGNSCFLRPAGGNDGTKGGYVRRLNEFPTKYLQMAEFFKQFPEYLPFPFDFKSIAERSVPHTADSLMQDSGYPCYERWKKNVINNEGIERLITMVER
jgi:hypothetical protein